MVFVCFGFFLMSRIQKKKPFWKLKYTELSFAFFHKNYLLYLYIKPISYQYLISAKKKKFQHQLNKICMQTSISSYQIQGSRKIMQKLLSKIANMKKVLTFCFPCP